MRIDIGPLTIVTVIFAGLTVRAVVRHLRGTPSFRGIGLAALAMWLVLTVWSGWFEVRHQVTQAIATTVVREVTGNDNANAVCRRRSADWMDLSGYMGMVSWDSPNVAVLRTDTCTALADWFFSARSTPNDAQGTALHVMVHEAVHVAGEHNEAITECTAITLDQAIMKGLGASDAAATAMVSNYLTNRYPYQSDSYLVDCSSVAPVVAVSDVENRIHTGV